MLIVRPDLRGRGPGPRARAVGRAAGQGRGQGRGRGPRPGAGARAGGEGRGPGPWARAAGQGPADSLTNSTPSHVMVGKRPPTIVDRYGIPDSTHGLARPGPDQSRNRSESDHTAAPGGIWQERTDAGRRTPPPWAQGRGPGGGRSIRRDACQPIPDAARPAAVHPPRPDPDAARGRRHRYEPDGLLIVDAAGRITTSAPGPRGPEPRSGRDAVVDLRPWLVLPGLVDLHVHLPQVPHAGLGFGTPLLDWLRRYVFPLEHDFTRRSPRSSRRPSTGHSPRPAPRPP